MPLVKGERTFYEIRSLAICINIQAFNWVNRKELNILKTYLEYLEFYSCILNMIVAEQITLRGLFAYKPDYV